MLMTETLDVFQADWAVIPSKYEVKPNKFKNATILISGHQLARAFAYTLLTLNDKLNLNANVILAGVDPNLESTLIPEVLQRDDFNYTHINRINSIKQKVDYVIHTGICGVEIHNNYNQFIAEFDALNSVVELAHNKNCKKIVYLSNGFLYGKGENHFRAFSEMELGSSELFDEKSQYPRTLESEFIRLTSKYSLTCSTLRCGVILGANSGIYNGLENVFKACAEGKEISLFNSYNKTTYIYLSDLFNSIIFNIEKDLTGVYNVGDDKHSVSNGVLAGMLHDLFGDNVKIQLTDKGSSNGVELNCNKVEFAGYKTNIPLLIALELSVLSYSEYNPNLKFPHEHQGRLDAIQQLLLGYLLEVDRICEKHNIKYFLGGGTLLGAARHKGFIPWDDDVDIMMLREDYDKFLEVAPSELPDGVILQDPKKDKNSFYCYAKLRLTDTMFATDFSKHHKNTENGFAFDIFCHDKTANSKLGQKLHSQLTLFWLAMVFNKWNHRKVDNGKKFQSFICNILKNIFPLRFSMFMLLKTLEFFKHKKNAKYLYDGMGYSVHKGGFDKTWLDDVIRVDFNGEKLPVPANYHNYLTNHYGNYMELAPLSTRLLSHEITVCDLGKYTNYKTPKNYNTNDICPTSQKQ